MHDNQPRFSGKIALVTGGSRGIGRAVALQLAREGADVVVNYRKNAELAQALVTELRTFGRRAFAIEANVADPDAIAHMFEVVAHEFGGLDFLISNAAAGIQSTLLDTTIKAWDLAMNVNARSYLLCAQAAVPIMKARGGGRIIALSARIAVDRAFPYYGSVAASKAAIEALTRYMAVEFGRHQIVVNAVSPGLVDTDALQYFREGAAHLQRAQEHTPVGRVTTPEDVAELVAFLCSDQAHQICGQVLCVDGGYTRLFV